MPLASRTVFIDTESFKRLGLNLHHPAISALAEHCANDKLNLLITSVVDRELKRKIIESTNEALTSLSNFRRKARFLEKLNDDAVAPLFQELDEESVRAHALSVYADFVEKSKCKIISSDGIDTEQLLNAYFEAEAPFHDGKKSEFPDAISLLSLLKHLNGQISYVVSNDADLKKFCDPNDQLVHTESIEDFLDLYNEHENSLTRLVKGYLGTQNEWLQQKIGEVIEDEAVYNEGSWEDSWVDVFEVLEVNEIDPNVVWIDDDSCLITFDVEISYRYEVTGPDFAGGIYDKESGKVFTFGETTQTGTDQMSVPIEVQLVYSSEGGQLQEVEFLDVMTAGTMRGIALEIEEHEDSEY